MRRTSQLIALLAAAGLSLAACGGDDNKKSVDSETEDDAQSDTDGASDDGGDTDGNDDGGSSGDDALREEYVAAITGSVQADGSPFDTEQATCLAEGMVDAIGVDTIQAAGVTPEDIAAPDSDSQFDTVAEDLTEEQATAVVDVIFGGECFSFGELLASQMGEDGPEIDEEQASCIGDAFGENEAFKQAFVDALLTGEDNPEVAAAFGDILSIFAECEVDMTGLG